MPSSGIVRQVTAIATARSEPAASRSSDRRQPDGAEQVVHESLAGVEHRAARRARSRPARRPTAGAAGTPAAHRIASRTGDEQRRASATGTATSVVTIAKPASAGASPRNAASAGSRVAKFRRPTNGVMPSRRSSIRKRLSPIAARTAARRTARPAPARVRRRASRTGPPTAGRGGPPTAPERSSGHRRRTDDWTMESRQPSHRSRAPSILAAIVVGGLALAFALAWDASSQPSSGATGASWPGSVGREIRARSRSSTTTPTGRGLEGAQSRRASRPPSTSTDRSASGSPAWARSAVRAGSTTSRSTPPARDVVATFSRGFTPAATTAPCPIRSSSPSIATAFPAARSASGSSGRIRRR